MAWVEITEDLAFYSLSEELFSVLEWLWQFLTKMSPIYYAFLFMALVVFFVLMLFYRLDLFRNVGDRK